MRLLVLLFSLLVLRRIVDAQRVAEDQFKSRRECSSEAIAGSFPYVWLVAVICATDAP